MRISKRFRTEFEIAPGIDDDGCCEVVAIDCALIGFL